METKELKYENEQIKVELMIPVVSGIKDQAVQEKINRDFEDKIIAFKDEIESSAKEYFEIANQENLEFHPYFAHVTYELPYNKDGIFSLNTTYSSYTGGAHGIAVRTSLNLDAESGKTLELKDFFKPDEDYQQRILETIRKQVEENKDYYFEDALDNLQFLSENQQFYLKQDKLVIYFGLYEIAPYAAGMPEFEIPISVMP